MSSNISDYTSFHMQIHFWGTQLSHSYVCFYHFYLSNLKEVNTKILWNSLNIKLKSRGSAPWQLVSERDHISPIWYQRTAELPRTNSITSIHLGLQREGERGRERDMQSYKQTFSNPWILCDLSRNNDTVKPCVALGPWHNACTLREYVNLLGT